MANNCDCGALKPVKVRLYDNLYDKYEWHDAYFIQFISELEAMCQLKDGTVESIHTKNLSFKIMNKDFQTKGE